MKNILQQYDSYREKTLSNRFFKHKDIELLLNKHKGFFEVSEAGKSFEGRAINLIKAGKGPVKVFLWSQMHGDEATATMALFDLLNFLSANDRFTGLPDDILTNCTLYIMPMANPDGAERFTRRNAQGIDINRDFCRLQSPEGKLLRELRDKISPHFGFNLHDQSVFWSAGKIGNPAAISLLAPAYDESLSVNTVRENAMKVIAGINRDLQVFIPNHVGRFDDEYEPRAFGDNFQAAGTSTILVEAGGYPDDFEKQFLRKQTFTALISGLKHISQQSFLAENLSGYFSIPKNEKRHLSILLKNCTVKKDEQTYKLDIGLVAEEEIVDGKFTGTHTFLTEDVGDLTGRFGYEELDASNFQLILTQPLVKDKCADFIVQDGLTTVLSIENGRRGEGGRWEG